MSRKTHTPILRAWVEFLGFPWAELVRGRRVDLAALKEAIAQTLPTIPSEQHLVNECLISLHDAVNYSMGGLSAAGLNLLNRSAAWHVAWVHAAHADAFAAWTDAYELLGGVLLAEALRGRP